MHLRVMSKLYLAAILDYGQLKLMSVPSFSPLNLSHFQDLYRVSVLGLAF
jgi:hypothetical protein